MPELSPSVPIGIALASAARTALTASAQLKQTGYTGIRIWLTVTAASGTGGLTVLLRAVNPINGAKVEINAGGAAITTAITRIYEFYPGVGGAAGFVQEALARRLPQDFDIAVNHADGSSYTYSVMYELLP
jgi:NADPH-dependent curcumin reductase CurA